MLFSLKTKKIKTALLILFVLLFIGNRGVAQAQILKSIQVYGNYTGHAALVEDQQLRYARGPGFGALMQFRLSQMFSLCLEGNYSDLKIEQNQAVEQWNWPFWETFYGNYIRSLVNQDSNYAVNLNPNQNLYLIPVIFSVQIELPMKMYTPFLRIGSGWVFYKRNLSLNENWQKHFSEPDYTFEYEYDNHAPPKEGQVPAFKATLGVEYRLFSTLGVSPSFTFFQYFFDDKKEALPLKSAWQLDVNLAFYY